AGKIIVISGNFSISRDEMKELIELHGGKNSSSLSGKTSFLLAGTKPGPEKMKKAEDLKIPVVSEDEFRKMLPEGSMPEDEVTEPDLFGGMVDD
ncbi:MAG TPA: DNA ligase (NAD(+)) LigA, partial [Rikenellaceae bacterium]|nr:DNA ligase (NAD(+)) LigA [Rikenellaceae bacterium]